MPHYIQLDSVLPGMFSSEREVTFSHEGKPFHLFVDESDVAPGNKLRVDVLERGPALVFISLPGETHCGRSRLFVSSSFLH